MFQLVAEKSGGLGGFRRAGSQGPRSLVSYPAVTVPVAGAGLRSCDECFGRTLPWVLQLRKNQPLSGELR